VKREKGELLAFHVFSFCASEDRVMAVENVMEKIVSLCKRRGFVFPASEIYGGINGFWDYGPLGVLLKNNLRDWWWRNMVECPPVGPDGHPIDMVGIDTAIIQNPKTWVASGHAGGFSDPMVDCRACKSRFRADHIMVLRIEPMEAGRKFYFSGFGNKQEVEEANSKQIRKLFEKYPGSNVQEFSPTVLLDEDEKSRIPCPHCSEIGTLTEPRQFNLMLTTEIGAVDPIKAYLRPETAQGIFLNFKNIVDTTRVKIPFGVAQIGKSFRNEVTPRNFIFRSREFEQMEMEWFCDPNEAAQWYEFWKDQRMKWWRSLGVSESNLRFRDHEKDELSHYSKMTVDIEYKYPFTAPDFAELEGIAHRGSYDLDQHQKHSGQKLDYFDQELQLKLKEQGVSPEDVKARSRYIPNVIEPASGLTRAVLVLLCESYRQEKGRQGTEELLSLLPRFAPIKLGIFPLVNKDGMPQIAEKLYLDLRTHFTCEYDPKQSIGKRYARMDEIGTPYCATVDGQTLLDQTVTIRHRDSMNQERIAIEKVAGFVTTQIADK
jgi:glycyl-tRNA synthetase